jgi:hypothetical protein
MLKPLFMSLGLAVALAAGTVVKAGGHGGAMPSAQIAPTAQCVAASPQGYAECLPTGGHGSCFSGLKHKFHMPKICLPKICLPKIPPKTYCYEWVLKKKCTGGGLKGLFHGNHGGDACGDGGWAAPVYATAQAAAAPSSQAWGSGQGAATYGSGQVYGAGQATTIGSGQLAPAPAGVMEPAPVEEGDAAPEAPVVPSSFGRLGSR